MPKDTFLNLPPQKRHLIEEAAIDEFATHGFDNASINRIVAQCQIAKGSFYQYFEDKKDLYKHLIAQISDRKLAYLNPIMLNPQNQDIFTVLEELYRSGLAFTRENPKAAILGNQLYKNRNRSIYKEIYAEGEDKAKAFYASMLNAAIDNGDVRTDINLGFIAHMLLALHTAIFDYYLEEVKGADSTWGPDKIEDDFMETVQMTLDFIKNGITLKSAELTAKELAI